MDKLRLLEEVMSRLQLSPREVIDYLSGKYDENRDQNIMPCPGMFWYSDSSYSFSVCQGKVISGVVGAVFPDWRKVLCVGLEEAALKWSNRTSLIGTENLSGQEATALIAKTVQWEGYIAPAVEYCLNYDKFGVQKGEAFLFSLNEARTVQPFIENAINPALKKIGCLELTNNYWTASEYNSYQAWKLCLTFGKSFNQKNYGRNFVRPMFWRKY